MRNPRRSMCAAILVLQGIVLGLVTPVLITVEGVSKPVALTLGLGLALAALVLAGLLRFEGAYLAGFALQVATLGLGVLTPAMIVLGLIFGSLWTTAYLLGKRIETDRAAWEAGGAPDPS